MRNLFLDESGELGTHAQGSRYFVVALIETDDYKRLKKFMKKKFGQIITAGWPKAIEIKGSSLFGSKYLTTVPETFPWKSDLTPLIREILTGIGDRINCIRSVTVNKTKLTSSVKTAPYGILYNYFASWVIIPASCTANSIYLIVDQRNKESHNLLHFDGYIKTKIHTARMLSNLPVLNLTLEHKFSQECYGLGAVDFVSWAIYRFREHGDNRFYSLIKPKIIYDKFWPQ